MRWLFVLMLTARLAHADEVQRFAFAGAGTAMSNEKTGWAFRAAFRMEEKVRDSEYRFGGALVGFDAWGTGERWGVSVPCGGYFGAQVGSVRTTLGYGFGMFANEKRSREAEGAGGIGLFVNASVEKIVGDLVLSLEGTITRQVILERDDHNLYTVMFMAGHRVGN